MLHWATEVEPVLAVLEFSGQLTHAWSPTANDPTGQDVELNSQEAAPATLNWLSGQVEQV